MRDGWTFTLGFRLQGHWHWKGPSENATAAATTPFRQCHAWKLTGWDHRIWNIAGTARAYLRICIPPYYYLFSPSLTITTASYRRVYLRYVYYSICADSTRAQINKRTHRTQPRAPTTARTVHTAAARGGRPAGSGANGAAKGDSWHCRRSGSMPHRRLAWDRGTN